MLDLFQDVLSPDLKVYGGAARLHTSFLSLFSAIAGEIDVVAV